KSCSRHSSASDRGSRRTTPFRNRSSVTRDRTLLLCGRLLAGRAPPDAGGGPTRGHGGQRTEPSVERRPPELASELPACGLAAAERLGYQWYHRRSAPRQKKPISQTRPNTTAMMNSHLITNPSPMNKATSSRSNRNATMPLVSPSGLAENSPTAVARVRLRALGRIRLILPAAALVALATALTATANVALTTISTDPYKVSGSQHATEVEPDSFSFGSTIVAATQVGRNYNGGSSNIGWGRSSNGGTTWTHGFLPGLTVNSTPPGPYTRASDPSVAYDAKHGVWLINSLGLTGGNNVAGAAAVVNRSTDGGNTWGNAVTVHAATGGEDLDKNWIVCDDTAASPFYGNCYVEFDNAGGGN